MYIYVKGIKLQQQKRHRSQPHNAGISVGDPGEAQLRRRKPPASQIRDNLNMKRNKNGNGSQPTEKK